MIKSLPSTINNILHAWSQKRKCEHPDHPLHQLPRDVLLQSAYLKFCKVNQNTQDFTCELWLEEKIFDQFSSTKLDESHTNLNLRRILEKILIPNHLIAFHSLHNVGHPSYTSYRKCLKYPEYNGYFELSVSTSLDISPLRPASRSSWYVVANERDCSFEQSRK